MHKELRKQIERYVIVGVPSTLIDFAVVNLLSKIFGIYSGVGIIPISLLGFALGTCNSYYFNKKWSFHDSTKIRLKQISTFFLVSGIGAVINITLVYVLTTVFAHALISAIIKLNVAKVFATGIAIIWNFYGYRHLVFRKALEANK